VRYSRFKSKGMRRIAQPNSEAKAMVIIRRGPENLFGLGTPRKPPFEGCSVTSPEYAVCVAIGTYPTV